MQLTHSIGLRAGPSAALVLAGLLAAPGLAGAERWNQTTTCDDDALGSRNVVRISAELAEFETVGTVSGTGSWSGRDVQVCYLTNLPNKAAASERTTANQQKQESHLIIGLGNCTPQNCNCDKEARGYPSKGKVSGAAREHGRSGEIACRASARFTLDLDTLRPALSAEDKRDLLGAFRDRKDLKITESSRSVTIAIKHKGTGR